MCTKIILIFCTQAILIQVAFSQCNSRTAISAGPAIAAPYSTSIAASTLTSPLYESSYVGEYPALSSFAVEVTPTSGGVLPVTSASAFSPELTLASENEYEGTLSVTGELPFIGTVGLEGEVPSIGTGRVNHGCGNGPTRITSSNFGALRNSAIVPAINSVATSAVGVIPEAFSSDFNYKGLTDYARNSQFGYSGVTENAYRGGVGEGNVAAVGQLPVAGDAAVVGQVPIMGSVNYGGTVPASGSVSISGMCNCNCPYV